MQSFYHLSGVCICPQKSGRKYFISPSLTPLTDDLARLTANVASSVIRTIITASCRWHRINFKFRARPGTLTLLPAQGSCSSPDGGEIRWPDIP